MEFMSYLKNLPKDLIQIIVSKLDIDTLDAVLRIYPEFLTLNWSQILVVTYDNDILRFTCKFVDHNTYRMVRICEPISKLRKIGVKDVWDVQIMITTSRNAYHENIWYLPNLQVLSFMDCREISIPESIRHMQSLRMLRIENTGVPSIHENITKLLNLTGLSIINADLFEVPPNICRLRSLSGLLLDENELETLPDEISLLRNLTHLSVCNNRLKSLGSISGLSNLERLSLESNYLKALPKDMLKLSNLKLISLKDNSFEFLPSIISQLPYLKEINISMNKIQSIYVISKSLTCMIIDVDVKVEGNNLSKLSVVRI